MSTKTKTNPYAIKNTLRPMPGFTGLFKFKQDLKGFEKGTEMRLQVVQMRLSEGKIQVYNTLRDPVPFHITILESEFSDYFTEILNPNE